MILQETESIDITIYFIVLTIIILVAIIIISIICLYLHISFKIHKSYHKGYNKAKSDKVQYYKTIKELTDSFDNVMLGLEGTGAILPVKTVQSFLEFKTLLQNYYND